MKKSLILMLAVLAFVSACGSKTVPKENKLPGEVVVLHGTQEHLKAYTDGEQRYTLYYAADSIGTEKVLLRDVREALQEDDPILREVENQLYNFGEVKEIDYANKQVTIYLYDNPLRIASTPPTATATP